MRGSMKLAALAVAGTALIVTFLRLRVGIDYSEESYYVLVGYRQALGDRPFLDDLNLSQGFGLITGPLIKLHLWLAGGTDGIVLYVRRLFLLMNIFTTSVVFWALKKRMEWPVALLIACTCLAFIPFNIPSLSYNTMGSSFFTAGIFLAWGSILGRHGPGHFAACGLIHGLTVVAYPNLLLAVIPFAVCLLLAMGEERARPMVAYLAALALVGVLALGQLGAGGFAQGMDFLRQRLATASVEVPLGKQPYWSRSWLSALGLALLLAAFGLGRWRPVLRALVLPLAPLVVWSLFSDRHLWRSAILFLGIWGLAAGLALPLLWRLPQVRQLVQLAWIPSLCAGLVISWSSSNGLRNAGLGLVPAALVCSILLFELLRDATDAADRPILEHGWLVAPALVCAALLSFQQGVYLQGSPASPERGEVQWGPFRGLEGKPVRDRYLEQLWSDIEPLVNDEGRIVFYDHFPAGYLLSPMKPGTPSIYNCVHRIGRIDPDFCASGYAAHLGERNVAVMIPGRRMLGDRLRVDPPRDEVMHELVASTHRLVRTRLDRRGRPLYRVYAGRAEPAAGE